MDQARFRAGQEFRQMMATAQVGALKSPDLMREGGTGGAVGPGIIRANQMDAIQKIGRVRDRIGKDWLFALLEAVVHLDDWMNLRRDLHPDPKVRKRRAWDRAKTLEALHYALDCVAVVTGITNADALKRR